MDAILSILPDTFGVSWSMATGSVTGFIVAGPSVLRMLKPVVKRIVTEWREALRGWGEIFKE